MHKLLVTLLIATAALAVSAKPSEGERFNQWLDASWEETLQRDPILATSLGDPRYNAQMVDDTTVAWRADHTRHLQRQLLQLKGFNPKALSDKDRLSYAILKLDLEQSLQGNRSRLDATHQPVGRTGPACWRNWVRVGRCNRFAAPGTMTTGCSAYPFPCPSWTAPLPTCAWAWPRA